VKTFLWRDLTLLPERAVWREASRTLFVADVHIGKAAAFRAAGLPAPAGTTRENLSRLDALIEAFAPRRLVVLGDLFHARAAYREASVREVAAWRARRRGLAVTLVAGNHDTRAGRPPGEFDVEVVEPPFALDGVECRHHPLVVDDVEGPPVLAGHLHPAARLGGPAHDSLRAPCFVMRNRQLILPAFGEFTGAALTWADPDTALCVVAGERLIHVRPAAAGRLSARR
jgi:DNA ligase-associated metallophosphoesterase